MIIQALVKRYEDIGISLPFWQNRFADYALNINVEGVVLDIIPLEQQDGKKRRRKVFLLPEEPQGRTSGIKAAFLCDNGGYFFGSDIKRGKEKFEAAGALHLEVLNDLKTDTAEAIKTFFKVANHPNNLAETGNYIFMVNGRYAHEDEDICNAWNRFKSANLQGETIRCLVTGKQDRISTLHGKIQLPGVSMGAVPLISINAESFASYGKSASDPAAQIGQSASFSYVTALNDLLQDDKHRKRLAQDTFVYWAEGTDHAEAETFSLLVDPQESDKGKLDAIVKMSMLGNKVNAGGCDLKKRFYLLCLSPNAGRISVRFFHVDSFGNILSSIARHYQNLEISGNSKFSYLPPWMILSETTVKKSASDATPLLGGQLLESIITDKAYPLTLFNAILTRIRAGEEINQTKAAVIKAVLIRNLKSEVATVSLNKDSKNIPYILGRLFSVLEYLQEKANGSSTIRQRYFSSACSNPVNVFPTLLSLSMHHADKLDNATWFEKQKSDLISNLDAENPFPSALSLQQQGEFIVGYYHQQQDRYTKKEEK
jgi:CRISPR-associated protein Csd1